jgi:hypothetical protein
MRQADLVRLAGSFDVDQSTVTSPSGLCDRFCGQRTPVGFGGAALYERTIDLGQVAACTSLVRILCRCWYHQLEGLVEDHVPAVGFSKL